MRRTWAALCAVALLVGTAACDPPWRAGPERHQVVLAEPAPPSAGWIVAAVNAFTARPKECPAATLETLAVLHSEGERRAEAFWLVDNVEVCWALIDTEGGTTAVGHGTVDGLTVEDPVPVDMSPGAESYVFTALPGRVDGVRVLGSDWLLGPASSRTVDLGGGKQVTFVTYGVRIPRHGESVSLQLCPPDGGCRDVSFGTSQVLVS